MNNFLNKLIIFSYKFTFIAIFWYKITMFLTKSRKYPVKVYRSIEEITKSLKYGKNYRKDTFLEFESDHLSHPTLLQKRVEEDTAFGDCDDYAIYLCTAIKKSNLAEKVWIGFYSMVGDPQHNGSITRQAHAICLFADHNGDIYWCDYHRPKKIEQIKDFMYKSAEVYNSEPICGVITLIKDIKQDDTPVFGVSTVLKP